MEDGKSALEVQSFNPNQFILSKNKTHCVQDIKEKQTYTVGYSIVHVRE